MVLAALAGCGLFRRPPATAVPVTVTAQRELLVEVRVEGEPFVFQLDTGATRTVMTPSAIDRLGWLTRPQVREAGVAFAHGAGGEIPGIETTILWNAVLGGREVNYLRVAVIDLSPPGGITPDGLLGQDVLGRYVVDLDLRSRQLLLHGLDDNAWRTRDLLAIPFRRSANGLIRIDVMLGDQPVAAILDLGATSTVASWSAIGERVALNIGATVGVDGRRIAASTLPDVTIGLGGGDGFVVKLPSLLVAELPMYERLGIHDRPIAILGVDALNARRIVIMPREHRVYISRPSSTVEP